MRFTPSANWSLIASASNRVVTWTVSIKNTTSLSEALSSGTWVDVTTYLTEFPKIRQQIEYDLGQFSSDSISLTARNIDWWEANIFNATESQYLEIKIVGVLSSGSTVASGVFYAFSGFIDKSGVRYDELQDAVMFEAFTADELMNRISILNVNTQYLFPLVDGANSGLILPRISGAYVVDANIASYPLKNGLHTIEFINATKQIRLDDGDYTTLSGSDETITLANLAVDQKISIYIKYGAFADSTEPITDYVIVDNEGVDTLPKQPFYGLSVGQFIKKMYSEVGITSTTLDTLQIATHDSTFRLSYYDVPPEDISVTGARYGICYDGTDLYVGVGNKLYKRASSGETYSLLNAFDADFTILKLLYNARNNQIWVLMQSSSAAAATFDKIACYDVGGLSVSNVLTVATYGGAVYSAYVMDYNYTGSSYKYAMVYLNGPLLVEITISGGTISSTTVYTPGGSFASDTNGVGFIKTDNKYIFQETDGFTGKLHQFSIDGSGAWSDDSHLLNNHADLQVIFSGAYNVSEDVLYYLGTGGNLFSVPVDSATAPTNIGSYSLNGAADAMVSDGAGYIYHSTGGNSYGGGTLYRIASNTLTTIESITSIYGGLFYGGGSLWGLDFEGRIFRYSDTINLYTKRYVFEDAPIRDILRSLLTAFNLTATISSHKKAFVYRRGNDSGTIQTTGNSITLDTSKAISLSRIQNGYQKIAYLILSNSTDTTTYNGSSFDSRVFSDVKTFQMSNDFIDTNILKDLAKYMFTFYNSARDTYSVAINTAQMQYEVMDGATMDFTTTKITSSSGGVIIGETINEDGSINLEVLI